MVKIIKTFQLTGYETVFILHPIVRVVIEYYTKCLSELVAGSVIKSVEN